jgi:hypothetical protein
MGRGGRYTMGRGVKIPWVGRGFNIICYSAIRQGI